MGILLRRFGIMWDMGRRDTKTVFARAFHELAAAEPVNKITVGEICDRARKSPATFYRHFHDKYELAAWDYALQVKDIANRIDQASYTWSDALRDHLAMHWRNRGYLSNLLTHTSGRDSFILNMTDTSITIARNLVGDPGDGGQPSDFDLYIRLYCHGITQLICEWIMGSFEANPLLLAQCLENGLPNPLRPFLLPCEQNERN